jgi:large repetitive protein
VDTTGAPFTTFGLDAQTFDADGLGTADASERTITSGTPNPRNQDFGYTATGSLGNYVWNDRNGDGVQDANEPGIPNVSVTVTWLGQDGLPGGDDVAYTTTTDAAGGYSVGGLPAGNYTVAVDPDTLPDNLTPTFDIDGTATADTADVTLGSGLSRDDVDFGYQGTATGSIGDCVWYDVDGDGVQDAGEPGIAGVTVTLLFGGDDGDLNTPNDNITYTATTDADGNYLFDGIPGGDFANGTDPNYRVTVTTPAGYPTQTFDTDGLGSANVSELRLDVSEDDLDQDFGFRGPNTQGLGDFVWEDLNGNGRQDAGEPGIDGITVELLDMDGNVLATTVTAGGGAYSFPNLADSATFGDYRVRFGATANGVTYTRTTANSSVAVDADNSDAATGNGETGLVQVPTGATNNDVDAGLYRLVSLGDRVWFDANDDGVQDAGEPGIGGATVTVTWLGVDGLPGGDDVTYPGITTGTDGTWTLGNLPPGEYSVAVSSLPAGLTTATYDLDGGTATPNGDTGVALSSGQDRTDVDFGFVGTASLGDRVWYDRNGNRTQDVGETGLNGVTVRLTWPGLDGDYATTADNYTVTQTTAGDGDYLFGNLPAGSYRVDVLGGLPPLFQPTYDLDGIATPDTVATTLADGQARTDVDFGYSDLSSFAGFVYRDDDNDGVFDQGERAIANVEVRLTGTDINGTPVDLVTRTGQDGSYKFERLITGTYTVRETQPRSFLDGRDTVGTPALAGMVRTNDSFGSFTLAPGIDAVNYNFGELTAGTSLSGYVYVDRNNDGVKQVSEKGIGGVVVRLKGTDDLGRAVDVRVTTDAQGRYSFIQMRPGTYRLIESHPSSFVDGKDRQGNLGGLRTNDRFTGIVIRPGDVGVNYNFGERGLTARALSKRLYITLPNGDIAAATPGSGIRIVDPLLGTGDGDLV